MGLSVSFHLEAAKESSNPSDRNIGGRLLQLDLQNDIIFSSFSDYLTMKFVFACTLALTASVGAFAPNTAFARSSAVSMSAVETPTYTFTKSEEIFAEAQHVRTVPRLAYGSSWVSQ